MDFITTVIVGDALRDEVIPTLPLAVNHWTGTVVDEQGYAVLGVRGQRFNGASHEPHTHPLRAQEHAEGLQQHRLPGEDIFIVHERTLPEGDGPARIAYWVGVGRCDTFADYQGALSHVEESPLVRIDPDNYRALEEMVEASEGVIPVSVESLVGMALDAFIQGAS